MIFCGLYENYWKSSIATKFINSIFETSYVLHRLNNICCQCVWYCLIQNFITWIVLNATKTWGLSCVSVNKDFWVRSSTTRVCTISQTRTSRRRRSTSEPSSWSRNSRSTSSNSSRRDSAQVRHCLQSKHPY